jgi:hypothetical protein
MDRSSNSSDNSPVADYPTQWVVTAEHVSRPCGGAILPGRRAGMRWLQADRDSRGGVRRRQVPPNHERCRSAGVALIAGSETTMTTVGLIARGHVDQAVGARRAGAGTVSRRPSTSAHTSGVSLLLYDPSARDRS